MATIKDVADRANVSIATVSRVLNGSGYVSPELDWRVREAVTALGYRPNALARNLRRSESLTLGVLIPDSTNPFFAELAGGVEEICFERGFNVVLCNTREDVDRATAYFGALYRHRVAGFVVVGVAQIGPFLQQVLESGFHAVVVDRPLPDVKADTVVSDNYDGARQAIEHLLALGHRRIGLIVGERYREILKARWMGVADTLRGAGIEPDPKLVYDKGDFLPEPGRAGAEYLLNQPDPPTAIFAFNDLMALGVLNYAQEHGIHIPEQLSVVGFDDISIARYAVPSLTTVAQPKFELGTTVAEMLLKRINGDDQPPITLTLPTRLIVRKSTGKAPQIAPHPTLL